MEECYFCTKSNTPSWVFLTFLKLYKWYQIAQSVTYALFLFFPVRFFLLHFVVVCTAVLGHIENSFVGLASEIADILQSIREL